MDLPAEVNVAEWEEKLVGKELIPMGGTVTDPEKQFAESDIKVELVRVLTPESMMTMDYRTERLNVYIQSETNRIVTKVTSG